MLRARLGSFEVEITRGPGDATRIARTAAAAGRPLLVAFGGDGTASEAAGGILASGAEAQLGLLPCGSGLDFARTLGVPAELEEAACVLAAGRSRRIDVGRAVFRDAAGALVARAFINAASFGLSGEVAARVNAARARGRRAAYLTAALRAAWGFRHPVVRVQADGEPPWQAAVTDVAICNGRFFGGGMRIAPEADPADGRLDLVVIGRYALPGIVRHARRLYAGTHGRLPRVHISQVRQVSAEPAAPDGRVGLELDGESPGWLPAAFELRPAALVVRAL
jgi:diacylglycerol kinase (ATP)